MASKEAFLPDKIDIKLVTTGVGSVTGKAIDEFDLLNIETEDDEKQILVFAEDLKVQAVKLNAALLAKVNKIEQLINPTPAEGEEIKSETDRLTEAAKELFGEEFKIGQFTCKPIIRVGLGYGSGTGEGDAHKHKAGKRNCSRCWNGNISGGLFGNKRRRNIVCAS